MGLITDLLPITNNLLAIGFPALVIFDRTQEERKYIKIVYFVLGSVFIFEAYRHSKIGPEIDKLLGSKIFFIEQDK